MHRTLVVGFVTLALALAGCGLRDRDEPTAAPAAPGGTATPSMTVPGRATPVTTAPATPAPASPAESVSPARPSPAADASTSPVRPTVTATPVALPDLGSLEQLLREIDAQLAEDAAANEGSTP